MTQKIEAKPKKEDDHKKKITRKKKTMPIDKCSHSSSDQMVFSHSVHHSPDQPVIPDTDS